MRAKLEFYRGKTVFLSGASGGLGEALIDKLCALGVKGLILSARREDILQERAAKIRAQGVECTVLAGDCADREAFSEIVGRALELKADVLIFAAGRVPAHQREALEAPCEVTRVFQVNTLAALQAIYDHAEKLRPGTHLAVVSSLAALYPLPSLTLYGASKAALSYACRALTPLLKRQGVKLSLIEPGFFFSPMGRRFAGRCWFFLPADKVASRTLCAIAAGRRRAAFPWPLVWGLRLAMILPYSMAQRCLKFFSFDTTA